MRDSATIFRRVRDEDSMRTDEAQMLLAERTPSTAAGAEARAVSAEGVTAGAPLVKDRRTNGRFYHVRCLPGNPFLDAHWSCLEKMGG